MKQKNKFLFDMLDMDMPEAEKDVLWRACRPTKVEEQERAIQITVPFQAQKPKSFIPDNKVKSKHYTAIVRGYGSSIVRLTIPFHDKIPDDSRNPMIEWDPLLKQEKLKIRDNKNGWEIIDGDNKVRVLIDNSDSLIYRWSDLIEDPPEEFNCTIYPDGENSASFNAYDTFFPQQVESISLGYIERNRIPHRCIFSLHAKYDEKFAGTGERFAGMNLAGKTLVLENEDGQGVNNRRAYKNVPFYVSSKGYGLLIMTSCHVRLSLADISTRAAQGIIEDNILDLFFIGGKSIEEIVKNYRRITGFPRKMPVWSYGTWMSKMTYFSANETQKVAERLRKEKYPCDVIHLDTGWFKTDWKCEWEFNTERFPNPEEYIKKMREKGFRISLWQLPQVAEGTKHHKKALENSYIARRRTTDRAASNFSKVEYSGSIDFTYPEAVKWYQKLLENLFDLGAAVIKTDFGEEIDMKADYFAMPAEKLHNLYALLYQKAAFEVSEKMVGKNEAMIWARAGWTGCQRYPVHWGGDSACTWDGLAGSIRGGLHLGLTGFAFWSHDVPGFHGLPNFMNSRPADDLYVRWTQVGVFTSHLRYHGTSVREPYNYPKVAHIVRKWLDLRYSLIPYLVHEGECATKTGYPILRALIFHHQNDPYCWHIDDEFYCGGSLLVAPILNSEGIRDIYLPKGTWIDFWTGEVIQGPILLKGVKMSLERMPVYAVAHSKVPVYPEIVQCTDDMEMLKVKHIVFDKTYKGFKSSVLGGIIDL